MAEDMNYEETHDIITLTLDDDSEVECVVLATFPVEDKEYIALMPVDELENEEGGEVMIFSFATDADGQPELSNIDSDEEYDKVGEVFFALLDEAEADSVLEDFEAGE